MSKIENLRQKIDLVMEDEPDNITMALTYLSHFPDRSDAADELSYYETLLEKYGDHTLFNQNVFWRYPDHNDTRRLKVLERWAHESLRFDPNNIHALNELVPNHMRMREFGPALSLALYAAESWPNHYRIWDRFSWLMLNLYQVCDQSGCSVGRYQSDELKSLALDYAKRSVKEGLRIHPNHLGLIERSEQIQKIAIDLTPIVVGAEQDFRKSGNALLDGFIENPRLLWALVVFGVVIAIWFSVMSFLSHKKKQEYLLVLTSRIQKLKTTYPNESSSLKISKIDANTISFPFLDEWFEVKMVHRKIRINTAYGLLDNTKESDIDQVIALIEAKFNRDEV